MSKASDVSSEGFLPESDDSSDNGDTVEGGVGEVESVVSSEGVDDRFFSSMAAGEATPLPHQSESAVEAPTNKDQLSQRKNRDGDLASCENEEEAEEESSTDDQEEDMDDVDEKLKPLLLPGEEISHGFNCHRVFGMDVTPALLLFGVHHFYIVDHFQLMRTSQPGGWSSRASPAAAAGAAGGRFLEGCRVVEVGED
eukprot:CAMPEP_0206375964 /NCGR_PEP_ID=MMETSP0294-20121207/9196_1 /ASSEMBLY_ACC=CAM_ASM_000327 /TAXON_ID=39354 /ORGANISM="Heterosigma akashiwo, Strain CCMP2393" /LENGTH=196 /DNA_ID=CAMNT_0053823991 /DNA_START=73 /DNA_END=660 /DNA_ORIENTATION=+